MEDKRSQHFTTTDKPSFFSARGALITLSGSLCSKKVNHMRCDKEKGNRKGSSIVLVPEDPQTRQPLPPSPGERAARASTGKEKGHKREKGTKQQ